MSKYHESQGHSESPAAPATTCDAPCAADFLSTPGPAAALPAVGEPDDPPPGAETGEAGSSLAPHDPASLTPYIDEHGFDPAEFKWIPVRRRVRKDGWSEARQRLFIEQLADSACVETAAAAAGMSVQSAYALRRAPGGEGFAAAWEAAIQHGAHKLADVAFQRALQGTDEPVFDRSGIVIGHKTRYSERLMMFLLRAHLPQRYAHAHAHRPERPEGTPSAPSPMPLAEALARLEPALPPEPHTLMPPDELDVELEVADIAQGELPHYYRPLPPGSGHIPPGEKSRSQSRSIQRGKNRSRPKLP